MKLDKKALYKHIVMLQGFRAAWLVYSSSRCPKGTRIFECQKLIKHSDCSHEKFITFALSDEKLPAFENIANIIFLEVNLLSDAQISDYVEKCKSFGIL